MTLSLRNAIILIGAAVNLFLLIAFCLSIPTAVPNLSITADPATAAAKLLTVYNGDLGFLLFLQLLSLSAALILYGKFRKTASPEIFFFLLFLLSMGMEGVRILPVALRGVQVPFYLNHVIVRSLYLSRFFGIFSLFTAGLFSNGMQYQKLSIAFGIILLTAFTLASMLPVTDTSLSTKTGLSLFDLSDVKVVLLTLQGLGIANFIVAWIRNNSRDYLWLALALFLVLAGFEAALHGSMAWLRISGSLILVAGIVIFSRRTHEIYLWI